MLSFFTFPLLIAATIAEAVTIPPTKHQKPVGEIGKDGRNFAHKESLPCENTPPLEISFPDTEMPIALELEAPAPKTEKHPIHHHLKTKREDLRHHRHQQHHQLHRTEPQVPPYVPYYWFNPCNLPGAIDTPGLECEGGSYTDSKTEDAYGIPGYYEDTKEGDFDAWHWGPWQDGEENESEKIRYGYYGWTQRCHRTRWSRWQCWYDFGGWTSWSWLE